MKLNKIQILKGLKIMLHEVEAGRVYDNLTEEGIQQNKETLEEAIKLIKDIKEG